MPSQFGFEPRSPRYCPCLVLGLFDGELEGYNGLLVGAIEARVECNNRLPSFGHFDWVWGPFLGQKRHFWGTKCVGLGGGDLPTWRPRPPAQVVIF